MHYKQNRQQLRILIAQLNRIALWYRNVHKQYEKKEGKIESGNELWVP